MPLKRMRRHWFLEGEHATLESRGQGLFFSVGSVTKEDDPVGYHAHQAVLWTKQEFNGDIRVSSQWMPVDSRDYGAILLYVQAQEIGEEAYAEDIFQWWLVWSRVRFRPHHR